MFTYSHIPQAQGVLFLAAVYGFMWFYLDFPLNCLMYEMKYLFHTIVMKAWFYTYVLVYVFVSILLLLFLSFIQQ